MLKDELSGDLSFNSLCSCPCGFDNTGQHADKLIGFLNKISQFSVINKFRGAKQAQPIMGSLDSFRAMDIFAVKSVLL